MASGAVGMVIKHNTLAMGEQVPVSTFSGNKFIILLHCVCFVVHFCAMRVSHSVDLYCIRIFFQLNGMQKGLTWSGDAYYARYPEKPVRSYHLRGKIHHVSAVCIFNAILDNDHVLLSVSV